MNEITEQPESKSLTFLDTVYEGKTHWGRYILSILTVGGIWFFGSAVFIAAFWGLDFLSSMGKNPLGSQNPIKEFVAIGLSFIPLVIGLWGGMRLIHRRPFLSLVTPYPAINTPRVWQGFRWQFLFLILVASVEELIYPGTYLYSLDSSQFYIFVILVILLIPIQATSEELLMRGYLLQAMGHFVRRPIVLILINGLIFMALHAANPEISEGLPAWLAYFAWGTYLTLITLKDNSAELAIGIHVANNMAAGILLNYKESALPTNAVFTAQEIHAWYALISYIVVAAIMYWIFFLRGEAEDIAEPETRLAIAAKQAAITESTSLNPEEAAPQNPEEGEPSE